jgi:hypothetical protein
VDGIICDEFYRGGVYTDPQGTNLAPKVASLFRLLPTDASRPVEA